jgi:hypothetical protein
MSYEVQEAFANKDLFCTSIAALMIDNFGTDFLSWEPETIELELRGLGVVPDNALKDKIMAVTVLLSTNSFHVDFGSFNNLCQVFNSDTNSSELFVPASIDDILWGCSEARILEGPADFDGQGFTPDIAVYVGQMLTSEGITDPPSVLNFAQIDGDELERRDTVLASDQFLFKSYYDKQQDIGKSLEEGLINKTKELLRQLKSLPLKHGLPEFLESLPA